jgi:hypothetical protein
MSRLKAGILTQQPEEEIVMWLSSVGGSILLVLSILAASLATTAPPVAHVPRIGLLHSGSPATGQSHIDAFRQGLRDLGYLEGQNIILEYRWAEGNLDRLPALAAELVRLPVVLIVTGGHGRRPSRQASYPHDPHRRGRRGRSGREWVGGQPGTPRREHHGVD